MKDPINRNQSITLYRNDIFRFLDWTPNAAYDLIWLDLCAQMTVNLVQQVCRVVTAPNKLAKESILAVTFMGSREHTDLLDLFQTQDYEEIRNKKFPELVINSGILASKKVTMLRCHKYKNDNHKSAPMRLYVFKIEAI